MARRAWGEGSVYFDNNKSLWTWSGTYEISGIKKRKTITAKKQIDLKNKVDRFKVQIGQGLFEQSNIKLQEWVDKWLEIFVKPNVKIKTYDNYKNRLKYVTNSFGLRPLKSITTIEVQAFFNDLLLNGEQKHQGLSAESVRCIRRYLKAVFDSAIKNGIIRNNPLEGTKPPRKTKSKIVVLDERQTLVFLQVAKKGQYIYQGIKNTKFLVCNAGTEYYIRCFYNLVNLALASGMRIGELRGLTWKYINFNKNSIRVEKQIIDTSERDCVFDDPKTENSQRIIYIDEAVIQELLKYKVFQKKYADMLGDQFENNYGLCFTNTFGKPFSVSNFRQRYFNKMLAEAGIDNGFTIHCMRHTHATLLLKNGVNAKVVSQRLGHSSVNITLNIYAHVLDDMEIEAPKTWAKILKGGK